MQDQLHAWDIKSNNELTPSKNLGKYHPWVFKYSFRLAFIQKNRPSILNAYIIENKHVLIVQFLSLKKPINNKKKNWSNLPLEIMATPWVNILKSSLKIHLYVQYFHSSQLNPVPWAQLWNVVIQI